MSNDHRNQSIKIVIAPTALKNSLNAVAACRAMARGVKAAAPRARIACVPVSDGGDSLLDALAPVLKGQWKSRTVTGPLGDPVRARYLFLPKQKTAIIEMARASGAALLRPDQCDPMAASTQGTGELIVAALRHGADHMIVGLGGSATNDGGIGMAHALGVRFFDAAGDPIGPIGKNLGCIRHISMEGLMPEARTARFEAVCDVDNPLLGKRGASRVFGPQKGATPEHVEVLEKGLENLANVMHRDLGKDARRLKGAGAAGGLGAGLSVFLNARLRPGVDVVLDLVEFNHHLKGTDLVLTAEGALDSQTLGGKAPAGVAKRALAKGIPCFVIAGSLSPERGSLHASGMTAVFSLCDRPMALSEAMDRADELLARAAGEAVRAFLAGCSRR
jgi:glycerate 2-kinase